MKDPKVVARTLARVRDAQDISQYQLADEMELAGFSASRNRIMNWERGRVDITICELAELARICRTHRIEFVPNPPAASNGEPLKRGLSGKVTVLVEFDEDPNQQPNHKKKSVYRVRKRRGDARTPDIEVRNNVRFFPRNASRMAKHRRNREPGKKPFCCG